MKIDQLETLLLREKIPYETNVNLKTKTWIHRGGNAFYYIKPEDTYSLEIVMIFLYKNEIKHLVVGSTSNLYILNTTDIPVVISTLKCNNYLIKENIIECECGVLVSKLARQMITNSIKGFEYLTKLPGTVGASIYNNSSVKGQHNSITALLVDLDIVTPAGVKKLLPKDLHFSFRSSELKKKLMRGVILKARLKYEKGSREEMEKIAHENEAERNRILEGPVQNLGCTVHKMFSNGPMPRRYEIPLRLYSKMLSVFVKDDIRRKQLKNRFLLFISGHNNLIPYISDKQLITFIWKDERADMLFDEYLQFMKEVCRTDQIEIEIIR